MPKLPTSSDYPLILHGDCVEQMRLLADCSIDAIVTDPPYGLGFMGKDWDSVAALARDLLAQANHRLLLVSEHPQPQLIPPAAAGRSR